MMDKSVFESGFAAARFFTDMRGQPAAQMKIRHYTALRHRLADGIGLLVFAGAVLMTIKAVGWVSLLIGGALWGVCYLLFKKTSVITITPFSLNVSGQFFDVSVPVGWETAPHPKSRLLPHVEDRTGQARPPQIEDRTFRSCLLIHGHKIPVLEIPNREKAEAVTGRLMGLHNLLKREYEATEQSQEVTHEW